MLHVLLSAANQQQIPVMVAAACVVSFDSILGLYHTIAAIFRSRRGTQATASEAWDCRGPAFARRRAGRRRPMRSPALALNAAPSPNASERTVKESRGTTGRHRRKIRSGTQLPTEKSKRIVRA